MGFLISVCSKVDGNESLKHQRREIFKEKCNNNVFDDGNNDDGGGNKDGDNIDSDNDDNVNNSQIIITSLKKAGEIIPILILILVFTYLLGTNEAVILLDLEVLRYFRLSRCQMCRPYIALFQLDKNCTVALKEMYKIDDRLLKLYWKHHFICNCNHTN